MAVPLATPGDIRSRDVILARDWSARIGYMVRAYMLHVTLQRDRLTDKLTTILRAAAIACGRSKKY